MKFLQSLYVFFVICLLSHSVFAQNCSFTPYFEDIEVINIGDRQIYTLFTPHLTVQYQGILSIVESDTLNVNDKRHLLRVHILRNLPTVLSEQSDVQKIARLARSGQIDWLGIEFSPNEIEEIGGVSTLIQSYNRGRRFLFRNLYLGFDPNALLSIPNVLSLMYGPHIVFLANEPEYRDRIRVVSLEDNAIKQEALDHTDDFTYWLDFIREDRLTYTDDQFAQLNAFIRSYNVNHSNSQTILGLDAFEEFLDEIEVEEDARQPMRMVFTTNNDFLKLTQARDEKVVQSILLQSDNGLILFGSAHRKGIQQGLSTACQNI